MGIHFIYTQLFRFLYFKILLSFLYIIYINTPGKFRAPKTGVTHLFGSICRSFFCVTGMNGCDDDGEITYNYFFLEKYPKNWGNIYCG